MRKGEASNMPNEYLQAVGRCSEQALVQTGKLGTSIYLAKSRSL